MDGWMDGWMDGRTDGRTNGNIQNRFCINILTISRNIKPHFITRILNGAEFTFML
jgi:hypothetical protein